MDYTLQRTKYKRNGEAAKLAVDIRFLNKEYKKVAPVRAELRAAAAWAK
jgi:hypothetical protein